MRSLLGDMVMKLLETPEVVNQLRKSLVNRDMAIEIDGKRYQIMKKRDDDEIEKLTKELTGLKSRLYDLESALKEMITTAKVRNLEANPEFKKSFEAAQKLVGM